jgi:DNA gyrase/topoisomerase IV subunit A
LRPITNLEIAVFDSEKIEEWIKEVKARPGSAPLIIQFIANRLSELTEWNEKLRAENLELRTGKRVADYESQITSLEYQLDMLKRQLGGELPDAEVLATQTPKQAIDNLNLIIYGPNGRIFRLKLNPNGLDEGHSICNLQGIQAISEPPRLFIAPPTEELLFIFTSGRIATLPVAGIPFTEENEINWDTGYVPEEPNLSETLACVAPISQMALADYYLQISRRGYLKKIRTALTASIMGNKFIGTGVKVPGDQTMDLTLRKADDRFVLISYEGYIQGIPAKMLPYAIVEAMRLGNSDHLVAALSVSNRKSILVMTQIGKIIHRTADSLEMATDLKRKGRMLYSTARRERGVRVIGAAAVDQSDYGLALHQEGLVSLHSVAGLLNSGTLTTESELLEFITFSA